MASTMAHSKNAVWTATRLGAVRTLLPFLYQTRTLSPSQHLQKTKLRFVHSALAPAQRRSLDSNITFRSTNIPSSRVDASSKAESLIHKSSNSYDKDMETSDRWNEDEDSWRDSPRTKVICKEKVANATEDRGIAFEKDENFDDMIFSDESDPFADEDMFDGNVDELGASSDSARRVRESTITVTERHAFERIFADIMARSKSIDSGMATSLAAGRQAVDLTKKSVRGRRAKDSVMSIMEEASKTKHRSQAKPFDGRPTTKTAEELQADIKQYPIPLRAAAARALGLASIRSSEIVENEIIGDADKLENIRQPERERVEKLMHDTKTDIELWHVMEAEVFALVEKLGLQEKPNIHSEETKHRTRKSKRQGSEVVKKEVPGTADNGQPLDLNVYGPLYPSYILLGLRLLDRSFAKPSPLVLNVLPRIKSLGIVSHVLGASTALYNELLRIHWSRYDDFLGATKLLNEMEQAGLEFDEETLNIVNEIYQAQIKVRRGDRGAALQALWSMPEFTPSKFKAWKEKIQASLEEAGTESSDEVAWGS